ncbi:MAG: prephenate dehydrogenase/arogenate dehydrogenase family protein [Haloarculaceae archaeon]
MKLLVVGAGEMGQWFAGRLQAGFPTGDDAADLDVAFTDIDDDAATAAADALDGRAVPTDTDETFDLVCVAVPLPATADAIARYAARADAAVVDVVGAMDEPVAAMREHATGRERVSFHPLFAAANAPGNVAVVVDEGGPVTDRVREALSAAGNRLFETTPAEHDEAMETVQARAHAAILAFGLAAADVREEFHTPISEGLFALLEQVTDGDPRVYADVQAAFEGADDVADAACALASADHDAFVDLYREARRRGQR